MLDIEAGLLKSSLVGLVPADVYATPDTTQELLDDNDMNIKGTNGFGNLLSEDLLEYLLSSSFFLIFFRQPACLKNCTFQL